MNITQAPKGYNVTLGSRAKALRAALQPPVRIEVIAAALDVHTMTVRNIEAGHGCRSETLPRLARYYGVSLDYLFGLTEDPSPATGEGALVGARG